MIPGRSWPVDPAFFAADLGCVHPAVPLWGGSGSVTPTTPAEIAARQVETADALIVPTPTGGSGRWVSGAAALIGHLNPHAALLTVPAEGTWRRDFRPSSRSRLRPVRARGGGHGSNR